MLRQQLTCELDWSVWDLYTVSITILRQLKLTLWLFLITSSLKLINPIIVAQFWNINFGDFSYIYFRISGNFAT